MASDVSDATTLYQVVISNSRDLLDTASGEIAATVERELREAFPKAREATLVRSRVITERRAVFSPTPGVESLRPAQRTPWPGVFWCGDWTATGWPSTMESAVRSGLLLADEVTRQ
jgi:zeta-carotene desaturase